MTAPGLKVDAGMGHSILVPVESSLEGCWCWRAQGAPAAVSCARAAQPWIM